MTTQVEILQDRLHTLDESAQPLSPRSSTYTGATGSSEEPGAATRSMEASVRHRNGDFVSPPGSTIEGSWEKVSAFESIALLSDAVEELSESHLPTTFHALRLPDPADQGTRQNYGFRKDPNYIDHWARFTTTSLLDSTEGPRSSVIDSQRHFTGLDVRSQPHSSDYTDSRHGVVTNDADGLSRSLIASLELGDSKVGSAEAKAGAEIADSKDGVEVVEPKDGEEVSEPKSDGEGDKAKKGLEAVETDSFNPWKAFCVVSCATNFVIGLILRDYYLALSQFQDLPMNGSAAQWLPAIELPKLNSSCSFSTSINHSAFDILSHPVSGNNGIATATPATPLVENSSTWLQSAPYFALLLPPCIAIFFLLSITSRSCQSSQGETAQDAIEEGLSNSGSETDTIMGDTSAEENLLERESEESTLLRRENARLVEERNDFARREQEVRQEYARLEEERNALLRLEEERKEVASLVERLRLSTRLAEERKEKARLEEEHQEQTRLEAVRLQNARLEEQRRDATLRQEEEREHARLESLQQEKPVLRLRLEKEQRVIAKLFPTRYRTMHALHSNAILKEF